MTVQTYHGSFSSCAVVMEEFRVPAEEEISGRQILFAAYGLEQAYQGDAIVIFKKDRKLYEVNGSHCSCMGLEGQWAPEETTWKALAMRSLGDGHTEEVQQAFNALVEEHL